MTLQQFLVILDRIDIYRTKPSDLIPQLCSLLFHLSKIIKLFLFILQSIIRSDLILLPHVGNPFFPALLQFLHLPLQTVTFFIQKADLSGKLVPLLKELLVTGIFFLFVLLHLFQSYLRLRFLLLRVFCFFFQLLNGLLSRFHLPAVLCQ